MYIAEVWCKYCILLQNIFRICFHPTMPLTVRDRKSLKNVIFMIETGLLAYNDWFIFLVTSC